MERVTQKEIARHLGVSPMTVSLALRNSPRLPEATRDRVRAAAEAVGYRPDPVLSALVSHRRRMQIHRDWSTLAFLTNWREEQGWEGTYIRRMFEGARDRALQIGYRLEPFWLRSCRTQKRAGDVLTARGVRGLLIAPQPVGYSHLRLAWADFAPVAIGGTLARPPLDRVMHDYAGSVSLAVHELRKRGYRRIGFCMNERTERISEHRASAAFLSEISRRPPLRDSFSHFAPEFERKRFLAWVRKRKPDCILTLHPNLYEFLVASGVDVPGEIGFVCLHIPEHLPHLSGIDYGARRIGSAAVDRVHTLIERNELGLPERPIHTLVPGRWVDGGTVCERGASLARRS